MGSPLMLSLSIFYSDKHETDWTQVITTHEAYKIKLIYYI